MDRPNTAAGLVAKRNELLALRAQVETELRKPTCILDHLDTAIRLFEPDTAPAEVRRYTNAHRAQKGQFQRFVLDHMRAAGGR